MVQYSFTLRKTKDNKNSKESDYEAYLTKFRIHGVHINMCYFEHTSGLHCHGIMDVPSEFNMKKFRIYGWNMKYDLIYNYTEWVNYCMKDIIKRELEEQRKCFKVGRFLPMIGSG